MREYRFRGKRKDNGEWVYGYYYTQIITHAGNRKSRDHFMRTEQNIRYEVDPDTVGQYTGLKDKSGKEIYEGDIIILPDEDDDEYFVIEWDDDTARFAIVQHGSTMCDFDNYYGKELCIIGNIYENPELLKENVQPMQRLVPAGAAGEAGRRLTMNRYKCPACGGNQYTSADTAKGCIYCGNKELKKMETLEPEVEEE